MRDIKPDDIIRFKIFNTATEAHIVKGRLEANGVPSFLADEHTIGVNPLYAQALGGIKLMIFARDIAKCKTLLDEDILSTEENDIICPYCHSSDVSFDQQRYGWLSILFSIIFFTVTKYNRKAWHCNSCKGEF